MKMLRSQYLKLQSIGKVQQKVSNKNTITKIVHSKGWGNVKDKHGVVSTATTSQSLGKEDDVCLNANNIKIYIDGMDETLNKLNVVLEYIDMDSLWLTNVYKTYENDLWSKKPYFDQSNNRKWLFSCELCDNNYKLFCSMKNHLNQHLKIYPYVCKICLKKHTNRKTATGHLKKIHKIVKEQWNNFLTS